MDSSVQATFYGVARKDTGGNEKKKIEERKFLGFTVCKTEENKIK